MSMEWHGVDDMLRRLQEYQNLVLWAVKQVALYWQEVFATYARENAPWDDRTGDARRTLHAWIEELAQDTVRVYLSHGMDYGLFLEVRHAGRWGIVWPTIQRHLEPIRVMLQGIFG